MIDLQSSCFLVKLSLDIAYQLMRRYRTLKREKEQGKRKFQNTQTVHNSDIGNIIGNGQILVNIELQSREYRSSTIDNIGDTRCRLVDNQRRRYERLHEAFRDAVRAEANANCSLNLIFVGAKNEIVVQVCAATRWPGRTKWTIAPEATYVL